MFTKDELNAKKYGELLNILKILGVKVGKRQKTAKVIELILEKQRSDEADSTATDNKVPAEGRKKSLNASGYGSDIGSPKGIFSETESILNSPTPTRGHPSPPALNLNATNLDIRSESGTEDTNEENVSVPSNTVDMESSKSNVNNLLRSDTYIIEDASSLSSSPKTVLNRSSTFTLSSSIVQQRLSWGKESKDMNLECDEVQTIEDIQNLESPKKRNSGSNGRLSIPLKGRRMMRRSLRGQLLESKVGSSPGTLFSPSPTKRLPSPPVSPNSHNDKAKKKVLPTDKISETSKKTEGVGKPTSIPRFVSYARSIKMPNFAKIHEKAFKKMEALDEYVDRKHCRTNSVKETKPQQPDPALVKSPIVEVTKAETGASNRKSVFTPKTSKARASRVNECSPLLNSSKIQKRKSASLASKPNLAPKGVSPAKKSAFKSALPKLIKENVPPKMSPSNRWNIGAADPNSPGSFQRRKAYVHPSVKPALKETFPKNPKRSSGQGMKPVSRRDTYKEMAKKNPKIKSRTEMRASEKVFIKGVRTNRRFELQMAKRGIQI